MLKIINTLELLKPREKRMNARKISVLLSFGAHVGAVD
jgi:hypothetical protein